jgi:hypothetical protein
MAKDHFVPRHYLRRFSINGSEELFVSQVSPYRFIGRRGIGGQCYESDFYDGDKLLDKLLWTYENDIAPILVRVCQNQKFSEPELVALRWFAASLHLRTRKAAEASKVLPRRLAYERIQAAINTEQLPPHPGGKFTEEMIDFEGSSGFLIKSVGLRCSLEMQTLACKLLKAETGTSFVTSDNPTIILNQFASNALPDRNFAGFSKSGFQLLLPICPELCLFFYDARVYKVGSQHTRLIPLQKDDVEVINGLQIQSAENSVYFHQATLDPAIQNLANSCAKLRAPVQEALRTFAASGSNDELLHFRALSPVLPKPWDFCRFRRHIGCQPGQRRDPAWSAALEELMDDFDKNPSGGSIEARMAKILADPKRLQNIRLRSSLHQPVQLRQDT